MKANFEFTLDKNTNCYFTFISVNDNLIPIQCDTGASFSSISALVLGDINYYSEDEAENIEKELLSRVSDKNIKQFKSASGEALNGFLTDMGPVFIGETRFPHFFYYFVPKNKTAFALLGNDFLNNCEYSHSPHGNIIITDFDENSYILNHKEAISKNELNQIINMFIEKDDRNEYGEP